MIMLVTSEYICLKDIANEERISENGHLIPKEWMEFSFYRIESPAVKNTPANDMGDKFTQMLIPLSVVLMSLYILHSGFAVSRIYAGCEFLG